MGKNVVPENFKDIERALGRAWAKISSWRGADSASAKSAAWAAIVQKAYGGEIHKNGEIFFNVVEGETVALTADLFADDFMKTESEPVPTDELLALPHVNGLTNGIFYRIHM